MENQYLAAREVRVLEVRYIAVFPSAGLYSRLPVNRVSSDASLAIGNQPDGVTDNCHSLACAVDPDCTTGTQIPILPANLFAVGLTRALQFLDLLIIEDRIQSVDFGVQAIDQSLSGWLISWRKRRSVWISTRGSRCEQRRDTEEPDWKLSMPCHGLAAFALAQSGIA
ncbi:hypothetical protein ACIPPQ_15880 [Sphingopyxis sp. LARHCG72]